MRKEVFLVGIAAFLSGFCVALMVFFVWFEFVGKEVLVPMPPAVSSPIEITNPSFPGNGDDSVSPPLDGGVTGPIGGDRDEHGCIGSAGYTWCETKQKCLRSWEESCESTSQSECGITNCHGLDIVCGSAVPQACTMIYMTGDKCRQYASCEVVNDLCQQKKNAKFDTCKSCVNKCSASYVNDPVGISSCEAKCG